MRALIHEKRVSKLTIHENLAAEIAQHARTLRNRLNEIAAITGHRKSEDTTLYASALSVKGVPWPAIKEALTSKVANEDVIHAALAADTHNVNSQILTQTHEAGATGALIDPVAQALKAGASVRAARQVLANRRRGTRTAIKTEDIPIAIRLVHQKKASARHLADLAAAGFGGYRLPHAADAFSALPKDKPWRERMNLLNRANEFIESHGLAINQLPHIAVALDAATSAYVWRAVEAGVQGERLPVVAASIKTVNGASRDEVSRLDDLLEEYREKHERVHPMPSAILSALKGGIEKKTLSDLLEADAPPENLIDYARVRKAAGGALDEDADLSRTSLAYQLAVEHRVPEEKLRPLARTVAEKPFLPHESIQNALNALAKTPNANYNLLPSAARVAHDLSLDNETLKFALAASEGVLKPQTALCIKVFSGTSESVDSLDRCKNLALATRIASGKAVPWAYAVNSQIGEWEARRIVDLFEGFEERDYPYIVTALSIMNHDAKVIEQKRERGEGDLTGKKFIQDWFKNCMRLKPTVMRLGLHGKEILHSYLDASALGTKNFEDTWGVKLKARGRRDLGADLHYEIIASDQFGGGRSEPAGILFNQGVRGRALIEQSASLMAGGNLPERTHRALSTRTTSISGERALDAFVNTQSILSKADEALQTINRTLQGVNEINTQIDENFNPTIARNTPQEIK